MSDKTRRVFVSHASEDKGRFAKPLVDALRRINLDAWYDEDEIGAGDRVPLAVFEDGLEKAGTVVILMTPTSLEKKWVKAEIQAAVTAEIEGMVRVVPVRAEPCTVPLSLRSYRWIDLEQEGSMEAVADAIARGIFGKPEGGETGQASVYERAAEIRVPGLSRIDSQVLELVFRAASAGRSRSIIQWPDLKPYADEIGLSFEQVKEATSVLCEQGYLIQKDRTIGRRNIIVGMSAQLFLTIAQELGEDIEQNRRAIAGAIINEALSDLDEIANYTKIERSMVDAIADDFADRGFCKVAKALGGNGWVTSISATFQRWFRDA